MNGWQALVTEGDDPSPFQSSFLHSKESTPWPFMHHIGYDK